MAYARNVALKIYISKAFDTLHWPFLLRVLERFGFDSIFCNWIRIIRNSAYVSVDINGKKVGCFTCNNGVRQGDPLSPLLFCLTEEVLSIGISNLVDSREIKLISGARNCLVPFHTLFADNIKVFYKGDIKSTRSITNLLRDKLII